MKYINKTNLKKIRFLKNKFWQRFLVFLLIFFVGILTERFDVKNKFFQFQSEVKKIISDKIFSFSSSLDRIVIDIQHQDYQEILNQRNQSIKNLRANEDLHKWVPASIKFNDKKYKIKIKLKGSHSDHWDDPKKWSFKIKLLNEKTINGFKRFSIQKPYTRNYLYEWLFMKTLKYEGLINSRNIFTEVILNGDYLGLYYLEEFFSKELIENNKRREGPIIGLDKDLWLQEVSNKNNLGANFWEDSFWRAKIKPVQFKKDNIDSIQNIYLKDAINLFENFRNKNLDLQDVFDLDQMSKIMAIRAIFGSNTFDWRDIKFYYNPITSLLEPIESEIDISYEKNISRWWLDDNHSTKKNSEQQRFIDLFIKNKTFYELFLFHLNRMSQNDYMNKIIQINKDEFDRYFGFLKLNYPSVDVFSKSHLDNNRDFIQNTLNPLQIINSFFIDVSDGYANFTVHNLQALPINLSHFKIDDKEFFFKNKKIIDGKKYDKPPENYIIQLECNLEFNCKNMESQDINIYYNILGQKKIQSKKVDTFYKLKLPNIKKTTGLIHNLFEFDFLLIDDVNKIITFNQKKIFIDKPIIIPENFTVNFLPGSEIIFIDEGHIISHSSLNIEGTENQPIIFNSNFEINNNDNQANGYGIFVLNSKNTTNFKHVIVKNLNYPKLDLGYGLMGSVNFYNTDVIIENSKFIDNIDGDDYVNIINSSFEIRNVEFINSKYDSIDLDFSNGLMENIYISNSGNDGIDFSGSNVKLENIFIDTVGDKGISTGEKSKIDIKNLNITNSNIGVASKDLSTLNIESLNIMNSNIIAAAYQKKPEYGPGYIKINFIEEEGNKKDYLSELNSKIIIQDKLIEFTDIDYSSF